MLSDPVPRRGFFTWQRQVVSLPCLLGAWPGQSGRVAEQKEVSPFAFLFKTNVTTFICVDDAAFCALGTQPRAVGPPRGGTRSHDLRLTAIPIRGCHADLPAPS